MDTKTKVLIVIIFVATAISVGFLYRRSYITQDFEINTGGADQSEALYE